MDRHREARRTISNGFNRRRHRTSSLRDSPDEDMGLELHESARLRDRVKKDRDRERDRGDRDLRERDSRDRDLRERDSRERINRIMNSSSSNKRRRNERLMNHRDDIDETSEESVNDDEDEEDDNYNTTTTTNHHHHHHHLNNSSFSQIHHNNSNNNHNITNNSHINHVTSSNNHHLQQRKTFPLPSTTSNHSKAFRAPSVWRPGDEVISVPVPRKARSASTKRSHDWISSSGNNNGGGGVGGEQIHRQTSDSPARSGVVSPSNQAPMPPSSSVNPSIRKKLKPSVNNMVPKLKPPKAAVSKPSSSNPEELEIEIAEVLYGLMTQSQGPSPSKKDEVVNRSSSDAKSCNSSPISNSTASNNQVSALKSGPLTAVAPKRKRPRQVPENPIFGVRSSLITAKDADQAPKNEIPSPSNLEKISASTGENGSEAGGNPLISQVKEAQPPEPTAQESTRFDSESKPSAADLRDNSNLLLAKEEIILSPKMKESSAVRTECIVSNEVSTSLPTQNLKLSMVENHQKEEKFEIDLMAPPPQLRSSTEGETDLDLRSKALDRKPPVMSVADVELKPVIISKDKEDGHKKKDQLTTEEDKSKGTKEDNEPPLVANENNNVRKIDLQLDLEKPERDVSGSGNGGINALGNKLLQQQKMPVKASREDAVPEKPGQSTSSMPLPLSLASWPGGLPPMGYMAPLQGVVSMDGATVTPAPPIQPLFSQPAPKRCATHCNIAKNIYYHQQFMKMNPYWQATASASPLFGSKPSNLGVLPGSDLHSSVNAKGISNAPDIKAHNITNNNSNNSKGSSQVTSTSESSQRKQQQVLIQQALPPVAPNNLLGPAFIFPVNQQQAALSVRPSNGKSPTTGPSSTTGSTGACPPSTALNFNYPNMGINETQYLAILQNNGYPFPIPTAPNFRGSPVQAMPMFNSSFYPSSQMIHPSQQNASNASNSSSSSQKHLPGQQHQRPQSGGANNNCVASSNLGSQKSQSSQSLPQSHNNNSEDSPSSDNRGSQNTAAVNLYGQNFFMPIHPQNFALMTQSAAFASGNSNQSEKKTNQPQGFALSFGPPMNGTNPAPSIDMSSMVQNHVIFQNSQDATRQNIQMMAAQAAAAAQAAQKKNVRISEDAKCAEGDLSIANDDERKRLVGKTQSGQSIAFTRSDLPDHINNSMINARVQEKNQQILRNLKQQQQQANRSKVPVTSNGSVFSEHLSSSPAIAATFQNALSGFSQNLVQANGNIPFQPQSPQWKGSGTSARLSTSQAQSSLASSTQTLKGLPQQSSRAQLPMHAQISFGGGNQKPSAASQGQTHTSNSNQTPSSPMMAGSPTTSSMSRGGASGSPRTSVLASTNGKPNQGSLSGHQSKNSTSISIQKPPSILGNPHTSSSNGGGAKMQNQPQNSQHQQQPLITKNIQHGQLFFSNPFTQVQSSSNSSNPSGYYMHQSKKPDKHQAMSSSGMLSLSPCPVTLSNNTGTNDPAKAIAAATNNAKNSGLPSQGVFNASQFAAQHGGTILSGFSYVHSTKQASEQKQPTGNDNLHQWQPEKK